jgi:riboflavin synthase
LGPGDAGRPGNGSGRELEVRLPEEFMPYCVYKGSICLNGVSLTIASVAGDRVRVALIPHTLEATTLKLATPGGKLNFEVDILAKHVERQLAARLGAAPGTADTALQAYGLHHGQGARP